MLKNTILLLCKQHDISISSLEKTLGFANSTISRWDKITPRIDNVQKVANYFNVSVDFLLADNDIYDYLEYEEKRTTNKPRRKEDNNTDLILQELSAIIKNYRGNQDVIDTRKIPIIGAIKCGTDGLAYEYTDSFLMVDESLHGDLFVLRTRGDSMINEGINEDDLAIIREQNDVENGEIAAVLIDGEEAALKRIVKLPGGIALESANPAYKTRYFMQEDANRIKILGKLIEVRKRF